MISNRAIHLSTTFFLFTATNKQHFSMRDNSSLTFSNMLYVICDKANIMPTPRMLKLRRNWMMEYCILKNEWAKCSICGIQLKIFTTVNQFKLHIIIRHKQIYENTIILEGHNWLWKFFHITESHAICNLCYSAYSLSHQINVTPMQTHLIREHNTNEIKAGRLREFMKVHGKEINTLQRKCVICGIIYEQSNSYELMIHLTYAHEVNAPRGTDVTNSREE